jgi:hypothetical protein
MAILNLNVVNPSSTLNGLSLHSIKAVEYDLTNIAFTDKMSYVIGHFIKENKIAAACKYYIDIIHDDDLDAAKSYIQSIYKMITFANKLSFEQLILKLIEHKYSGNTALAITEFMKYAVCDKKTAEQVIGVL